MPRIDALQIRALEAQIETLEAAIEQAVNELRADAPKEAVVATLRGALANSRKGERWTRQEIVDAIQTWHQVTGMVPSSAQWSTAILRSRGRDEELEMFLAGRYPSADTVRLHFGSFPAAVVAAGLEPVRSGVHRQGSTGSRMDERLPLWTGWEMIGGFRQRKGMTVRALTEATHISYNHLRRIETGEETNPTIRVFLALSRGLGVRAAALLDEQE